jgi:TRAP-type C4-dicarboxylate transport system substrate-binding protein
MGKKRFRIIATIILTVCFIFAMTACSGNKTETPPATEAPDGGDSGSASAAASEPSGEVYEWKLGTIFSDPDVLPDFNTNGQMCKDFAALVEEYSNGQIKVTCHYGSSIGSGPEMYEMVTMNELEVYFGMASPAADPRFAVFNLPFVFNTPEQFYDKALDAGRGIVAQVYAKWLAEHDIYLAAVAGSCPRGIATTKKAVVEPADVKDLKVRVIEDPIALAYWQGLAQTQVVPSADVYSSLQTGNVDAVDGLPSTIATLKYYEVTKTYTDIDWLRNVTCLMIPNELWNSLTPELQDAVNRATYEAVKKAEADEQAQMAGALSFLEDEQGVEVTRLTTEQRQAWIDHSNSLTDKYKEIIGAEAYDEFMEAVEATK